MRSYPLYGIVVVCLIVLAFIKGCGCNKPHPEVHRHTTVEKTIKLRSDSTPVAVDFPPKHFTVKAKANKKGRTDKAVRPRKDHPIASLDSIGFFSVDTTQVYPDTLALRYDEEKNEFDFSLKTSIRRRLEIVKFLARDSVTFVRDSVLVFIPENNNDVFIYSAIALAAGILIGVLAN